MRPSCLVGVVIANGSTYWLPWTCDCNLQMFGVISCGPAGEFKFNQKATAKRLEKGPAFGAAPKSLPKDWSTYRSDSRRSASAQAKIPAKVRRIWRLAPPERNATGLTAPTTAGGMVFVGGFDGTVRALDAAGGKVRWTSYTGGAVRCPPTIAGGRAFVGSADGWAYAFEAATGKLIWRFRAAPIDRRIPVYGVLQSNWPVSGGVIVRDNVAYFAAGMIDFDGTHVYALNAADGRIIWQNNSSGHLDSFSRRGVAAQGDMLLDGERLFLAGGNAASPGIYDAKSGECLTKPPAGPGTRSPRGRELTAEKDNVSVSGQPLYSVPASPVYDGSVRWRNVVVRAANARLSFVRSDDKKGWKLVARDGSARKELWSQPLGGEPVRWGIAVDAAGRVFVTLRSGEILAFAADSSSR